MRRLLFALGLLLLPVLASAQMRDALLTPDGTLFSVESVVVSSEAGGFTASNLVLRKQQGTESTSEIIPATIEHGAYTNPSIAYDAQSKTLFVFWLRHVGLMSSQLLFACRDADGVWTPARTFGDRWNYRRNLRIALTRRVSAEDGTIDAVPAISVHLVWWETDSEDGHESAQYAMVTIENGKVEGEPDYLTLAQFAVVAPAPSEEVTVTSMEEGGTPEEPVVEDVDPAVLRQPLLFASAKQESVLVIFGDLTTRRLHQVRVRPTHPPVSNGRLRVPVGRGEGSSGAPTMRVAAESNTRIEGIYGSSERLALFTRDAAKVQYVILKDGAWTSTREITLDEQITSTAAVEALRRLLTEH